MTTDTSQQVLGPPPRWPIWKIVLAYAVMLAVAIMSIWTIDGHVMKLSEEMARQAEVSDESSAR